MRLALSLACFLFCGHVAQASNEFSNYDRAELWFNSLSEAERIDIQTSLIWASDYNQIIDGIFGPNTFKSIKDYETKIGSAIDGYLEPGERSRLRADYLSETNRLGFRKIFDDKWKLWLGLPTAILDAPKQESDGTTWKSKDGRLIIVIGQDAYSGGSFPNSYRQLATSAQLGDVKYRTFRPGFFVISGVGSRGRFYMRMHDRNGDTAGFIAAWSDGSDADIRKLIVAISNSLDTTTAPAPPAISTNESSAVTSNEQVERQPLPNSQQPTYQMGTGFFVTPAGYLLTNAHVVVGCRGAKLLLSDGRVSEASIVAADSHVDLALLKSAVSAPAVASFRAGPTLRLGTDIIVFGYPRLDILTSTGNLVNGLVSGLAGPDNDASLIQISAPVQRGNSGGAVLDKSGNVVGVVVAKTNLTADADAIEVLQQANFAISGDVVRSFLDEHHMTVVASASTQEKQTADIADLAKSFTAIVSCQPQ